MEIQSFKFFKTVLNEASDLSRTVRRKSANIMSDIESQRFLNVQSENRRLARFIEDSLEDFEFLGKEKKFVTKLESAVGEMLHTIRRRFMSGQNVDYERVADEFIGKLNALKKMDFYLNEDARALARRAIARFPELENTDLPHYLKRRSDKIDEMVKRENAVILDALIGRVPQLIGELKSATSRLDAQKKTADSSQREPGEITIYIDESAHYRISSEDARSLGYKCESNYYWLSADEYAYIKANFRLKTESIDSSMVKANVPRSTMIDLYFDESKKPSITQDLALELGYISKKDGAFYPLSDGQYRGLYGEFSQFRYLYPGLEYSSTLVDDEGSEALDSHVLDDEGEPGKEKENVDKRPTTMLYLSPDGQIHSSIPMGIDRVRVEEVGPGLAAEDLLNMLEEADIVWVKYDANGVLSDAAKAEVDRVIDSFLGSVCSADEVRNVNGVRRYRVKYLFEHDAIEANKIV